MLANGRSAPRTAHHSGLRTDTGQKRILIMVNWFDKKEANEMEYLLKNIKTSNNVRCELRAWHALNKIGCASRLHGKSAYVDLLATTQKLYATKREKKFSRPHQLVYMRETSKTSAKNNYRKLPATLSYSVQQTVIHWPFMSLTLPRNRIVWKPRAKWSFLFYLSRGIVSMLNNADTPHENASMDRKSKSP